MTMDDRLRKILLEVSTSDIEYLGPSISAIKSAVVEFLKEEIDDGVILEDIIAKLGGKP